jgi:hypothetical protein
MNTYRLIGTPQPQIDAHRRHPRERGDPVTLAADEEALDSRIRGNDGMGDPRRSADIQP